MPSRGGTQQIEGMAIRGKSLHTKAIHGGLDPAAHGGAVSVPIYQTSTFAFPSAKEGAARFGGSSPGMIYTRMGNPTVQALEACVSDLEEGCGAIATATGMAAISTAFLALLRQGDHVVATHPLYGATARFLALLLPPQRDGVFVAADTTWRSPPRSGQHAARCQSTRRSASTSSIAAASAVAQASIPLVVVTRSPARSIAFSADVVLHSAESPQWA